MTHQMTTSNYDYDEEEPMEIDTSGIKTPMKPSQPSQAASAAPAQWTVPVARNGDDNERNDSSTATVNTSSVTPTTHQSKFSSGFSSSCGGPKIVKAIRPGLNKNVPTSLNGHASPSDENPFKSRPRICMEPPPPPPPPTTTNPSNDIVAPSSSSSATSSSSSISDKTATTTTAVATAYEISVDTKSNLNGDVVVDATTTLTTTTASRQQISPATLSSAASSSSSSSSGNTDTSSVGSLSPQQSNTANTAVNQSNDFGNDFKLTQFHEFTQQPKFTFDDLDAAACSDQDTERTPKNQANSSHHYNQHKHQLEPMSSFDIEIQVTQHDQQCSSVNNIFESIFNNEQDFQSFLDVLEKKEISRPDKVPKYSDFARKSLYLPFDTLLQSKNLTPDNFRRLSVIREKQAEIKSFLSTNQEISGAAESASCSGGGETVETTTTVTTDLTVSSQRQQHRPPIRLGHHLEEDDEPAAAVEKSHSNYNDDDDDDDHVIGEQSVLTSQVNQHSILFDSIFSNDQEFQMFLDVLEKKEVNDSDLKISPNKYSEFARKSLYLLFDPIVEKDKSIAPDKAQRLNHLREKQDVLKAYLSEIAEEPPSTTTANEEPVETATSSNQNNEKKEEVTVDPPKQHSSADILVSSFDNTMEQPQPQQEHQKQINDRNTLSSNEDLNAVSSSSNKRESLSASHSFDSGTTGKPVHNESSSNYATPNGQQNGGGAPNNSILDLDKLSISKSPTDNSAAAANRLIYDLETGNKQKLSSATALEANASALKARMESIKSQNLERKQQQQNIMTSSQIGNADVGDESAAVVETAVQPPPTTTIKPSPPPTITPAASASNELVERLQAELQAYKERERSYVDRIAQIEEENDKFQLIAVEFEQIFHQLVKEKEEVEAKHRNEIIELTKERDHLQEDVVGIERSFDDLHRRFENLKTKVVEFRKNEESLQKALETYQQQLDKEKLKYSTLKKHAEEKLETANIEIDKLRKSTSIELQALKAELKKAEIKISSLELNIQQKDQENSQLTSLLEELLNKVKPSN